MPSQTLEGERLVADAGGNNNEWLCEEVSDGVIVPQTTVSRRREQLTLPVSSSVRSLPGCFEHTGGYSIPPFLPLHGPNSPLTRVYNMNKMSQQAQPPGSRSQMPRSPLADDSNTTNRKMSTHSNISDGQSGILYSYGDSAVSYGPTPEKSGCFQDGEEDTKEEADFSDISLPTPPDGGWGWVICAAAFVCMVILDGMMFSFGVFFLDLLEDFGESKGTTAWVGSTLMGTHLIVGPITSMLVNIFGCRKVAMVGAVIAFIGFTASVFVPNIPCLILTYGVVGGIGASMVYIPSILIVGFYFEKRRALANGIATGGSGVGCFMYAPLCRFLQDKYTWRGALLILAAICLNCVVCGALYRPIDYKRGKKQTSSETTTTGDEEKQLISHPLPQKERFEVVGSGGSSMNVGSASPALSHRVILSHQSAYCINTLGRSRENIHGSRMGSAMFAQPSLTVSQQISQRSRSSSRASQLDNILQKPLYRKDIFYSGSVARLPEFQNNPDSHIFYSGSILRLPDPDTFSGASSSSSKMLDCEEIGYIFKTLVGLSLLRSPVFLLCVVMSVLWTTHATVLAVLPDYAVIQGTTKGQAGLLLSGIGISNIVGRLLAGWLADHPQINVVWINATALFIGGIVNWLFTITSNYYLLATEAIVFGLCMATWTSLRPIVLVELLGLERLTNAFGLLAMFQGCAFCIGTPVAGFLFDLTQSYKVPFYIAGAAFFTSGLSCLPMRKVALWEKERYGAPVPVVESKI